LMCICMQRKRESNKRRSSVLHIGLPLLMSVSCDDWCCTTTACLLFKAAATPPDAHSSSCHCQVLQLTQNQLTAWFHAARI
jgi:hypothetical protein